MSLIKIKYECEFDPEKEAKDALDGVKLIMNQQAIEKNGLNRDKDLILWYEVYKEIIL